MALLAVEGDSVLEATLPCGWIPSHPLNSRKPNLHGAYMFNIAHMGCSCSHMSYQSPVLLKSIRTFLPNLVVAVVNSHLELEHIVEATLLPVHDA